MFDLIDECGKELKRYGYSLRKRGCYGVSVASLKLGHEKKAQELGLRRGQYYIITSPFLYSLGKDNEEYLTKIIADKLKIILKEQGVKENDKILLACLGNPDIEGDRLGKEVFDRVGLSTLKGNVNLYKFCPNIYLFTGVETAEVIKMFVNHLKIKCVVIIDSLSTSSLSRLGTSFQLSSGGMTPGSGVARFGKAIEEGDVGAKCISIGVPFMINSKSIEETNEGIILVPKDVSSNVAVAGRVIANAINRVLL